MNWSGSDTRISLLQDPDRFPVIFIRIKKAYSILGENVLNYELSFRAEEIWKGTHYDSKEFRMNRSGSDPLGG